MAATFGVGLSGATAQDAPPEGQHTWNLDELYQGFCVHFLVDAAAVAEDLPTGARIIPAERDGDLHPSLRSVVSSQPEFAGWAPSRLCLFYFGRIAAEGVRITEESPRKAPMLALWTVAAEDSGGERRDVALEVIVNSSRLERPGREGGLSVIRARTSVGPMPEDEEGRPSLDDRYTVRVGKTMLQWDGRAAGDSVAGSRPVTMQWRAEGRNGGWVDGTLRIAPRLAGSMIGALKVQGKGDLAEFLLRSPTRFVGPGYIGGGGTLALDR